MTKAKYTPEERQIRIRNNRMPGLMKLYKTCNLCKKDLPRNSDFFNRTQRTLFFVCKKCKPKWDKFHSSTGSKLPLLQRLYKTCSSCKKDLPRNSDFFTYEGVKIHTACRDCKRDYERGRNRKHSTPERRRHVSLSNRMKVIDHYSNGSMVCECCSENEFEMLNVDHIEGRKKWGHDHNFSSYQLIQWLIRNDFPEGFRILCYNCNVSAYRNNGTCIHQIKKQTQKSQVLEIQAGK